jgi:N-carbamoyl-L-amino-acid hydrolase
VIDPALYRRLRAGIDAVGREPSGWNRLAWGPGEDAGRDWFRSEARALGLGVVDDPAGNVWAVEPGAETDPWVATGSHLDTVVDAGALDGALGVVAGLVAVDAVRRAGGAPRPLAVGALVDEEGPRFGAACFGSRALVGELDLDEILERRDADGDRLGDLAARRGVTVATLHEAPAFGRRIAAWLEVHVEQGRRLADGPAALGVGTVLAARERWSATVTGEADHAGSAPMAGRRDALVTAARIVGAADRLARAEDDVRATVGSLQVRPGSSNVVPGEVVLTLDVRSGDPAALARVRDGIQIVQPAAWRRLSGDPGGVFDAGLRDVLHRAAAAAGTPAADVAAYAGHDAGVLARHLPAAMLFVRNPTGRSHHPDEDAREEDCLAACQVLARALTEVAGA